MAVPWRFLYLFGVLIAMGFLIQQLGLWAHKLIYFIPALALGIGITLILMMLVLAGAQASSIGQYIIAACVTIPLITTSAVCWFNFTPKLLTPFAPYGLLSVVVAAPKVLFAFLGFECVVSLYPIVKKPDKNVPRAFLLAIGAVSILYLLFAGGLFASVPISFFSEGVETTLAHVLEQRFPMYPLLAHFVLFGALFGIIGTIHSMLWSASELMTDVLKKMKSPAIVSMIQNQQWTNTTSVLVSTAIMFASTLLLRPHALMDLTAVCMVSATVLSIMALLFLPEEWRSGRNIVTVVALLGGTVMVYFAGQSFIQALVSLFA